jgi:hypothetical protein
VQEGVLVCKCIITLRGIWLAERTLSFSRTLLHVVSELLRIELLKLTKRRKRVRHVSE